MNMVRGWSPEVTIQEIWAKSPSFMTSLEKEKAPISGSSKDNFDKNGTKKKNIRDTSWSQLSRTKMYESSTD